ncbi:MAG TPA: DinB family protein [Bryobacteraceae bacterium]
MAAPELAQYRQQFEDVKTQAQELTAGLNEEKFNWRPAPNQWSIEECLAHLIILGQWTVKALETAIDQGHAQGRTGTGPFRYGRLDRFFLKMIEPPVRRKVRAPRHFVPLHGQPITGILPTFLHLQDQLLLLVERAEGLDLARIKVATPISRLYKMSLGMTFASTAAHERRHILQARRVRELLPQVSVQKNRN